MRASLSNLVGYENNRALAVVPRQAFHQGADPRELSVGLRPEPWWAGLMDLPVTAPRAL